MEKKAMKHQWKTMENQFFKKTMKNQLKIDEKKQLQINGKIDGNAMKNKLPDLCLLAHSGKGIGETMKGLMETSNET